MFKVITHYVDGDTWEDGSYTSKPEALRVALDLVEEANSSIVDYVTVTENGYHWHAISPLKV